MLSRYFGPRIHSQIHVFVLCALASSVVFSKFVMSLGMMLLLLNILLEGQFSTYWKNIRASRLFLWVALFFLLHLVSLLWSDNLTYGFHDIKAKLPLIVIPLVLVAKPIENRSYLKWILGIFLAAVLFVTFTNFLSYHQLFGPREYNDIRGMSLFDSHVRLALMVVMGIVVAVQLYRWRLIPVFLMTAIVVWLHFYTYYSQVLSGVIVLIGIYTVYGFYWLHRRYKLLAFAGLSIVVICTVSSIVWVFTPMTYDKTQYTLEKLGNERTAEGHLYEHNPSEVCPETGKPIDIFICPVELRREWNAVSEIPYDGGRDVKGQLIFRTLARYMASMDLRKDAEGFSHLKPQDIRAIEHGQTSFQNKGVWARINGIRYQFSNVSNPNGHSFLQRIEYWKTAVQIIEDNWMIGIGGGDVQDKFNQLYDENNSLLTEEHRDRAHNMYLTSWLSFGILGLVLLLLSHFHYFKVQFKDGNLVGLAFIVIMLISYLVEDTLETQSGVTFFGLFYGLFCVPRKKSAKN